MPGPVPNRCCGGCKSQNYCATDINCCLECHFAYEEEFAFPYLPRLIQNVLRRDHDRIRALGFPPELVHPHSEREMRWFRAHCPTEIVAQIDHDHASYGSGRLRSRDWDTRP